VLTELFGAGWPAPHRVVPNAATEHHLSGADPRGPRLNRALNRITGGPGARYMPVSLQVRISRRSGRPTTAPPTSSTRGRSTRGRRSPASATCAPPPRSFPISRQVDRDQADQGGRRDALCRGQLGRTAMSSRANLPFASSGSPSG
jgi:hypothetical protein